MNASAISFGFAATAILIAMFLLMAIFEHLIKPGWAAARASRDAAGDDGHAQDPSHSDRHRPRDHGSPDKLAPPPKVIITTVIQDPSLLARRMNAASVRSAHVQRVSSVKSARTSCRARVCSAMPACVRARCCFRRNEKGP
jgi:hypothetical protein